MKPSGKDPEAAIRAAWFAAIKIASPDTIADAGEAWIDANKAYSQPRYIEKLSDWLERRAWELEPPWQKPKSRANGKSKSHTNGHGGKERRSDDSKNELRAAGLDIADREDAKRRAQS